ncbi:uncharacterized protein LOC120357945 isoform X2 [Solenopsis invicta]|uniref:uncharacterized protein LOC120357945 isoform X2 n=1 Tax=Solenopsis invicta TaxID=13686 RepID=UPI00193CBED2|nr:uncharacterized protein LOC120357945 isoform X2 [Solenopsis invicta]
MNSEMEMYYATNKFFLLRIGGWPYQRKILKVLIPCFFIMVHYSTVATQILLLYDTWGDVNIAVECIISLTVLFAANVKFINIVVNNDKFRWILQLMNKHWKVFNSEFERHILRYYANIGKKTTNYFAVYFMIAVMFYLTIPLLPKILDILIPLNESRPLAYIYQAEYRVDKEKYYYPILLHCSVTSIITVTILFTVDTTYIICVLHACSLFTAVSQRLENMTGEIDIKSDDDEENYTEMHYQLFAEKYRSTGNDYRELITCLKKHQLALEHVQILNSTFNQVTFIVLCLNMLILSVIGIQLINNLEKTEEVIRYVFVSCGAFTHLICMCIPGQLLIDQSTKVFDKASAWHTFSIKTRRLLRILLYRSLVPSTLTAGQMFVMSMTMCSSVRLIYSFKQISFIISYDFYIIYNKITFNFKVTQSAMSYFTAFLSIR